jgi:translocation and assembly module TamB
MRRALGLLSLLLLGGIATGALWLGGSENGLQTVAQLAGQASGGKLQIEAPGGRLLGPLNIASLRWETPELQVQAEQIRLDWSPAELLHGRLQIAELSADKLHIVSAPNQPPSPPPTELLLPLAIAVEKFSVATLSYGNVLTATQLAGRLESDGQHHQLSNFHIQMADTALSGQATLDGAAPLPLALTAEMSGQLADKPLAINIKANGPLERITLELLASQGIEGQASAILTPFAPAAFASARIALANIDPAAWQDGAPTARLNLTADLAPQGEGVAGRFSLNNPQPGPLDRQRLPLASLSGHLDWQGDTARLTELKARLPGSAELNGSGQWQDSTLSLDLQASRLDAAQLVSSLRPTRLNGPVSTAIAANRQSLRLDLKAPAFAVLAQLSHAADLVSFTQLELSAGNARLAVSGDLKLDKQFAFKAEGELSRFDPSRFAKLPAAQINARFKAGGKLAPRPLIDGSFELRDSQLAGHALSGKGRLSLDWPRIPLADIQLAAGPNVLSASGAFGKPGDTLAIVIAAPQLAPYGLEGGLTGRLDLSGSVTQPQLKADLQAAKLGLPGLGRLSGLSLKAAAGGEANSPLHIDLTVAQVDTPEQAALAKALRIQADGSNAAHQLRADVEFIGHNHVNLLADGGLQLKGESSPLWRGRLLEARLASDDKTRNARLTAPAALQLAANAWSFGPAQLAGDPLDWQATVQAAADPQHLTASLSAKGTRVGQIKGQLSAGMQGAWSLDSRAPWQGSLQTDIADVAWLADLIGDGWQSEGRFQGELKLAGTPAEPVASGRFRGEKLGLRQTEQGLNLANGTLLIDLDDNLLRVRQLSFDSLLQAVPRPLRLAGKEEVAGLTRKPGRLEISGEMRIDRNSGADNAFLDIHLDRLGAFQLPDQWVLISGDGRLTWQDATFGARGKLAVDAGYWQLAPGGAPQLSDDVVIRRPGTEKGASKLRPKLDLDITADLGKNFHFHGAGLTARLNGDLRLRASGRDLPRATGSIRTRDGRFDAYGQQLSIERGILTFQGLLDNPALDVRAVRKGLAVEPGVQIGGTAQRPVVKLISDPELPDPEKLAWLVLGHGPEQMGAGDATVLLSAAGGLLGRDSGNLVGQLKKTFGIDEFGVRQGDIGGTGTRQPSSRVAGSSVDTTASTGSQIFSVGKRLSSNALLSYEQALGKAESVVKLTVNLTRQISIIGRAGSDNALDIFYTLSFGRETRRPR